MHCMVLGRPITAYVAYKSILLRQISAGTVLLGKSHFSGTVSHFKCLILQLFLHNMTYNLVSILIRLYSIISLLHTAQKFCDHSYFKGRKSLSEAWESEDAILKYGTCWYLTHWCLSEFHQRKLNLHNSVKRCVVYVIFPIFKYYSFLIRLQRYMVLVILHNEECKTINNPNS